MTRKLSISKDEKTARTSQLAGLLEVVNSERGNSLVLLDGSAGRWPEKEVIRTGSLQMDLAIGIGGWPRGRVIEFYGMESSGKTTTLLHTIAEAQRAGMAVVFIDAENALDPAYCRVIGVDTDLMLVNQPDHLQQAQDLMALLMKNAAEHAPNGLLIVVDSIPALAASEVMEASAEQQTRALSARYWSAQLPKLAKLARESGSTIFLINQMRDSMDMYTPASTPGGRAIKFYSSVRLEMKRKIEGKNNEGGSDGQHCNFSVVKNKVGSPFKKGTFYLPAGKPIDWVVDVIEAAKKVEVVHADKKWENGKLLSKKGWFTYVLAEGDAVAMQKDNDDWNAGIRKRRRQVEAAIVTAEKEHDEDTLAVLRKELTELDGEIDEVTVDPDQQFISIYRAGAFEQEIRLYPSLVASIEDQVLNTLNKGVASDANRLDLLDDYGIVLPEVDEEIPDGEDAGGE